MKELDKTLDSAAQEYCNRENRLISDFVTWIVDLWSILSKYRDEFKASGQWMNFLEKIWISISKANAQIRMYEYIEKKSGDRRKLIWDSIRNWKKMNLFLALPEEEKEKIMEKIESGEITKSTSDVDFEAIVRQNDDLQVHSQEDVGNSDIVVADEVDVQSIWDKISDVNKSVVLENPTIVSSHIQKELWTSINSRGFIEHTVIINNGIQKIKSFDKSSLNSKDKEALKWILKEFIEELESEITFLS